MLTVGLPEAAARDDEQDLAVSRHAVDATPSTNSSHVLPGALSAELDPNTRAVGSGWGGYDGATHNPVASATAEAWIVPRLSLMAGFGSTTQPGDVRLRAQGGLRLMVLEQARHGVNVTLGFLYREDRFTDEEGMLEWSALVSRRFGDNLALVRLLYAQDGEGDDHEGEVRAAFVHDVGRGGAAGLHWGVDAYARTSLGSSDPHRFEHANPTLEFSATPVLAYTLHRWSVLTEAGVAGQKVDRLRTGALVLGGFAAAF